ncbi:MAG: hypothetical protein UV19_C0018G0003 [Parcubacteria group bacterium GW2011_GWA2_42_28]|nr:MAG: hypothetical protein UV19_C0018G0003 [Parcubacteria group bacterium GW2011_GWA2_42_28]
MEDNDKSPWFIIILVIMLIWSIFFYKDKYEGQTAEEWFNEYDYQVAVNENLESRLSDYQDVLQEANNNIDEAKWYAWESYDEMGEALDNLDTVFDPY